VIDVSPSTSLPPLVEGQLQCFLKVTVSKILWTVSKPSSFVLVRLRWWGETTDGTVFRPRDSSQTEQKGVKTTTRFAVRCALKQFTSYLTDMGTLVFDVMTKLDHFPIGRAQIKGISQLSPEHPISGFFSIVSPTSDKLGELQTLTGPRSGPTHPTKLSMRSEDRRESESRRVTTPRALLDQGNKLRDAMVISAFKSVPDSDTNADPTLPSVLNSYSFSAAGLPADAVTSPIMLKNMLNHHRSTRSKDNLLPLADSFLTEIGTPSETKAIELLLGSSALSIGRYWDGTGSPPESISGSDFCCNSELNDPLYDQSLLDNLFYTTPKSDGSVSDPVSDDELSKRKSKKGKSTVTVDPMSHGHYTSSGLEEGKDSPQESSCSLTVDQLTTLGRVHTARVVVESLKIPLDVPSKKHIGGKPPRPSPSAKQTFFVEFHFPVSSRSRSGEISTATEITRLVSSKIVGGYVKFQQRFAFPLLFDGQIIEYWWGTDLSFRIFHRKGTQKKPELIGSATLPMREILQSPALSMTCNLPVCCTKDKLHNSTAVGPLKVCIELAASDKDFQSVQGKTLGSESPSPVSTSTKTKTQTELQNAADDITLHSVIGEQSPVQPRAPPHILPQAPRVTQTDAEEDGLLLHVVLMVPEGKELMVSSGESSEMCNSYLKCKLFSTQEASRSPIIWANTQPVYNFSQVAPVTLTSRLLERLKNNVMIIEIWNREACPGPDQLLGLAKLPLHQFYMSFSDPKISRLLLQAQYPVVAVDSYVPIFHVFNGLEQGKLKVLLAMGSGDQVVALQRLKNEEGPSLAPIPRPAHFLDPPLPGSQMTRSQEGMAEHVFEIHVDSVKGLTPLQATVWGEADCFVQYYFPSCSSGAHPETDLPEIAFTLKPVRTATTLCVPDPVFNDRQSHSIPAQSGTPVQRLLLSAYSMQGLTGGGGVPFEVWCRYYYPNVRDQMIAKGVLPLSRLCAMVTMQHREDVGVQSFSLPLTTRSDQSTKHPPPSSGLLNVNMTYRRTVRNPLGALAARMVSISVQIHGASGLQAAARLVAEHDASFQYSADVGVNAYVAIHPTFLPEVEVRSTRAVARSFSPEFDHHCEFPCSLVIQRSNGETCSLAEILHHSEIVLSVHHQNVATAASSKPQPSRDYHLGIVRIPGRELMAKRSGVSGWYPVTAPDDSKAPGNAVILQTVVGGLELSVRFAHPSDRDRVLELARSLGWNEENEDAKEAAGLGDNEWNRKEDLVVLSVRIPKIWLPLHCLLLAGHKHLHKSTYCYLRYKFYDKEAICSPLKKPKLSEDGQQAMVMFDMSQHLELMKHQPLVWYLREERLEIQVWRSYGKDTDRPRPQDMDRLIGCAYVDLKALSENTSRTLTVSGVYPVFKRGVSNLWGAAVRIHLALSSAYHPSPSVLLGTNDEEGSLSEEEESRDSSGGSEKQVCFAASHKQEPIAEVSLPDSQYPSQDVDLENTFGVNVVVERAMHLSLKGIPLTEQAEVTPSCCVSFPVSGNPEPVTTPVVPNTDSPMWNFQLQSRFNRELLLDPQQTLVFKVWHKADMERVLGFASVDLSPLLSGFQSVCGWYNIVDFIGQCRGQIKVSITPLESVAHLKEKVPSQRCVLYQPSIPSFSSFSHRHSQSEEPVDRSIPPVFPYQVSGRESDGAGLSFLRHEEHVQNVRRFHESLQQAERNTHSAEHSDALSQSSRSSLLSALRKNLCELDDIQKYFNQKLYRSISSTETPGSPSEQVTRTQPPTSIEPGQEDSDAQALLKKSSFLVSQVSNLITDLQGITKVVPAPSGPNQTVLEPPSAQFQHGQNGNHVVSVESSSKRGSQNSDTPPFSSMGSPTVIGDRLTDFIGTTIENGIFPDTQPDDDEPLTQESSDGEYEEDVIEPLTLNEITTLTDRTSPWSSIVSERDLDHVDPNLQRRHQGRSISPLAGTNHGDNTELFSSFHLNDQGSISNSARTMDFQGVDNVDTNVLKTSTSPNSEAESIEFIQEMQLPLKHVEQEGDESEYEAANQIIEDQEDHEDQDDEEDTQENHLSVFQTLPAETSDTEEAEEQTRDNPSNDDSVPRSVYSYSEKPEETGSGDESLAPTGKLLYPLTCVI
ncbi:hypothetical protein GDO86_019385, partial [Hymenochirus boettgeri]